MRDWEGDDEGQKDYIAFPKDNGYQSIHQYIKRKGFETMVEVQVRTREMHLQAEFGAAAHWSYKDQIFRPEIATSKLYRLTWRSAEQLAATQAMEVIRLAQAYLNEHRVFVFLEDKSEVLNLKKSSTALDAAFSLHSDIGLAAENIYVDGRLVANNTPLKDGQVISVKTTSSKSVAAQVEALTRVRTPNAKQAIRRHLREHHSEAVLCLGIVQLLLFLSSNQKVIDARIQESHNPNRVADVWQIQKWVKVRLGKPMDTFLQELGLMHSKDEFRKLMGGVLDVKPTKLRATSLDISMLWARIQGQMRDSTSSAADEADGTMDYATLHKLVLEPLFDELLPSIGYVNMRQVWSKLMGGTMTSTAPSKAATVAVPSASVSTGTRRRFCPQRRVVYRYCDCSLGDRRAGIFPHGFETSDVYLSPSPTSGAASTSLPYDSGESGQQRSQSTAPSQVCDQVLCRCDRCSGGGRSHRHRGGLARSITAAVSSRIHRTIVLVSC